METALALSRNIKVPSWLIDGLPPGVKAWVLSGGEFNSESLAWK